MELPDSKALSRRAGGSLQLLSETSKAAILVGYRRISYLTGIVLGTESSNRSCLDSLFFEGVRHNVQSLSTLGALRFNVSWVKRSLSNDTFFLLPD